jgi:hypothetical protein
MRVGTIAFGACLVIAGLVFPGVARACDISVPDLHTVDPAQVGVDQTPPQLMNPTVAEVQNNDHDSLGCSGKCGWDHSGRLTNLATDDMTPAAKIGYRVTLVAGAALHLSPSDDRAVLGLYDGSLMLFWDGDDFDFTVQLIAVDAAGNESAPKTVRISDGGGCRVGGRRVSNCAGLVLALIIAAARPRRRPARR